jgi:hypothetical protein
MAGIDQYTVLMLHMDGANNAFVDSATDKAITAVGNATQANTQSKFGGIAGVFAGNGNYISTPDHGDFNFGSGDFTIDFWAYPTSFGGQKKMYTQLVGNGYSPFSLYFDGNTLKINATSTGSNWDIANGTSVGYVLLTNRWIHIACCRTGGNIYTFLGGSLTGIISTSATLYNAIGDIRIGDDNGSQGFVGYLDEYRVSKGIARWSNNFVPPTKAYDGNASVKQYLNSRRDRFRTTGISLG